VKEPGLLGTDVDEGGLDARKHRIDTAQKYVSEHPTLVGTVQHDLDQLFVFQERHP
jgi:hypothetical protein